ncbi:MAG: 50S ribosomal protein L10 [Fimbriimonadaceae bacterium]
MPTAEKAQSIEQAKEWYSSAKGLVFTDYRGLKVKEMQALRAAIRAKGGELHVLKNTLFRIAAGDDTAKFPDDLHNGPTAVAFVFENESEVAKSIFDYALTHKSLQVKGGFFNGTAFDAKGVERLSKLPSRDVLLAQIIGLVSSPLSNLVGVIEALYADPIRVIGAVADKVAGPAEEAKAAPAEAKPEEPVAASASEAESAPVAEIAEEPAEASAEAESVAEDEAAPEEPVESPPPAEESATTPEEAPASEETTE